MRLRIAIGIATALTLASLAAAAGEISGADVRSLLLAHPVSANLGGDTSRPLVAGNAFSFQVANAPRRHQRPFSFGNRLFNTNWVEAPASVKAFDGLGPMFNRVSCSGCHTKDGRGQPPVNGTSPMNSMLFRISIPGSGVHGAPKPVPGYGDQLSERGIGGVAPEGIATITYREVHGTYGDGTPYALRQPTYAIANAAYGALPDNLLISARVAPQMIGLGLLEAVPDATLEVFADPDDADGDGVSGRVNRVWNAAEGRGAVGRFGWKAGQPDLLNQNAAAAIGDIGLTTSIHARENCDPTQTACKEAFAAPDVDLPPEFLDKLTLYSATLAVPAQRNASDPRVRSGAEQFRLMGCAFCHMPTLQTRKSSLPELANQTFHPYTDLLLHDMGEGLADHRPEFEAGGSEWRTPPLWGLGLVPAVNGHDNLLHDGRARGFAEAILWHGGEAEASRENFRNSVKEDRDALIAFLQSL